MKRIPVRCRIKKLMMLGITLTRRPSEIYICNYKFKPNNKCVMCGESIYNIAIQGYTDGIINGMKYIEEDAKNLAHNFSLISEAVKINLEDVTADKFILKNKCDN